MTKKGFTLIELMVTVSIMIIMTLVVFFNYSRFNENSLLNALAYDLSLTIRQAQVYGEAVKEGGTSQSGPITTSNADLTNINFRSAYGVHFDKAVGHVPVLLFVDAPTKNVNGKMVGDGVYNSSDDGPPLQTYSFQRGINIKSLCVTVGSSEDCGNTRTTLDITFLRPDPEAIISANGTVVGSASSAKIVLRNAGDTTRKSVVVYSTGQISVQN